MKQSAMILLKIDEKKDFIKAYKKMNSLANVVSCDATRGDIDIFMRIEEDSEEKCLAFFNNTIKPLEEAKNSFFLPVKETLLPENEEESVAPLVKSFILAEMDETKLSSVRSCITKGGMISKCEFVKGDFNVVLTINGSQFAQIDKFISNNLINLDGIVKLKEYPVIDIYENQ